MYMHIYIHKYIHIYVYTYGSYCICWINDFHNIASTAIVNVSNFLCFSFDFLLYPALDIAHDGVGFVIILLLLLFFFPKYFQIPGPNCVSEGTFSSIIPPCIH